MKQKLEEIRDKSIKNLDELKSLEALEKARVAILGKKGELTQMLRGMGKLTPEERPVIGKLANEVRQSIEDKMAGIKEILQDKVLEKRLEMEKIDITMPGREVKQGRIHPLNIVLREIEEIFLGMGFDVAEGPEVELSYYNFDALNTPKNHPARDMQDTFYINPDILLRTHTSPTQIRTMEKQQPPLKIIVPGRVYRCDEVDASHSPVFHQIEGLVVDKNINMGDLKGTLGQFARECFGPETRTRFRPHHFPFTEPSAEVDVSCANCGGNGCRVCKGSGWIEILGAGMVHPNVLRHGGIDPDEYSGFAFGMGLDRITMLKYNINDIRLLLENDLRFLKQF